MRKKLKTTKRRKEVTSKTKDEKEELGEKE